MAVGLPALALVVGILALGANPSGRGDGAGAIGSAVLLVFGVATACALGGIAGNGIVLVSLLVLFLRD